MSMQRIPYHNGRYVPVITTISGRNIDPQASVEEIAKQIDIGDIAQGLSMQARFNGQSSIFISVAAHSLNCESMLECLLYDTPHSPGVTSYNYKIRLAALLHDAAEAYLGDCITPLKSDLFKLYEEKFMRAISLALGVEYELFAYNEVKHVDCMACHFESYYHMARAMPEIHDDDKVFLFTGDDIVDQWKDTLLYSSTMTKTRSEFLSKYRYLYNKIQTATYATPSGRQETHNHIQETHNEIR